MKRVLKSIHIFAILLAASSCGLRTDPKPSYNYSFFTGAGAQPADLQVATHFRGEQLVISCQTSEASDETYQYRLNIWERNQDCNGCLGELVDSILMEREVTPDVTFVSAAVTKDATTDETTQDLPEESDEESPPVLLAKKFQWNIPPSAIVWNSGISERYYTIEQIDSDGDTLQSSEIMSFIRPLPIPEPKISVKKLLDVGEGELESYLERLTAKLLEFSWNRRINDKENASPSGDRNSFLPLYPQHVEETGDLIHLSDSVLERHAISKCYPSSVEYLLALNWKPRREAIQHSLKQDGIMNEEIVFYGINLYKTSKDSFERKEELLTSEPLYSGSFLLVNFTDLLYARHQDRFGNESEGVLVFDGVYQ